MRHASHSRGGYITLQRKLIDNEVFSNEGLFHTFTALMFAVNWKAANFDGRTIEPGQMVFDWRGLPERLQGAMPKPLSINTIRNRIEMLSDLGIVKVEPTTRYSILTLCNWGKYQFGESDIDTQNGVSVSDFDTRTDTRTDTYRRRGTKGKKGKKIVPNASQSGPPSEFSFPVKANDGVEWNLPKSKLG